MNQFSLIDNFKLIQKILVLLIMRKRKDYLDLKIIQS